MIWFRIDNLVNLLVGRLSGIVVLRFTGAGLYEFLLFCVGFY